MAGLSQTVPALLRLICAWVVRGTRRASLHWSAFSGFGALSFGCFVAARQVSFAAVNEPLRANRRALEEKLLLQLQRSLRGLRGRLPFCVLMLDADHFKRINDRLGHGVGNLELKHLATLLLTQMRSVGTLGRVGGEEFVVLLPGLNQDGALLAALSAAERLHAVVANSPLEAPQEQVARSVSIGVAQWGRYPKETTRLLMRADAALYQAKQNGRDRVALAESSAA